MPYTDAERYHALRQLAILAGTDPDRADEISSKVTRELAIAINEVVFDQACDELCKLMQSEDEKSAEKPETE
jgi:hypothetical protein